MKKATITFIIAFSMIVLSSATLRATQTIQISELMNNLRSEIVVEQDINLEPWMYNPFTDERLSPEKDMEVMNWMIETGSWSAENLAEEPELEVKDWMIRGFESDNSNAVELWMSHFPG